MSVMDGQNGMGRSAFLRANGATVGGMLQGYSLEVLPRTAAKIESFKALLPVGTRVYIANVEGTDFEDMIQTARRIRGEGFDVMPHFPARLIKDAAEFETSLARYRDEAGVDQALLIGGGVTRPVGAYDNTMQMLESGLLDQQIGIPLGDKARAGPKLADVTVNESVLVGGALVGASKAPHCDVLCFKRGIDGRLAGRNRTPGVRITKTKV